MSINKLFKFFALLFIFTSCKNGGVFDNRISEGIIEYEITYPDIDDKNPMKGILPSKMIYTFKDPLFISELNVTTGFRIAFISDSESKKLQQIFKSSPVKKYTSILSEQAVDSLNKNEYGIITISETNEEKKILDFNCKKVKISFDNTTKNKDYDLYYTEDIKFNIPNWSLPFHNIKGVPLEYELTRMGYRMKFTAVKFVQGPIDMNSFKSPEDYKMVDYELIEEEIRSIVADLHSLGL